MRNWYQVPLLLTISLAVLASRPNTSSAQTSNGAKPAPIQQPSPSQAQGAAGGSGQALQGTTPVATTIPQNAPPMGQPPFPPLEPQIQTYLDQVLAAWEKRTAGIQRYQCAFSRWEYDEDPKEYQTAASGVIRYMAPDKGMFRVEEIKFLKKKPDGTSAYEAIPGQFGEWWICDGTSIHQYDQNIKKVKKYHLPPSMRGAEVFNSPLPFVFGVKAEKINARYWVRPLPPPADAKGNPNPEVILLEAYPKSQADAVNYHHVAIYLHRSDLLPMAIVVHLTNWTAEKPYSHRDVFEFRDRKIDGSILDIINENVFRQSFIPQEPPKDWTVEEVPFVEEADDPALRAATPPNGVQR